MQRSGHTKLRKAIWEAMHPADKGGKTVSTLVGVQQVGFASETASVSGMTKQSISTWHAPTPWAMTSTDWWAPP